MDFFSDIEAKFDEFEGQFWHLQTEALKELKKENVLVETIVSEDFSTMPRPINRLSKYEKFINKIKREIEKEATNQLSMSDYFRYMNQRHYWNFFEYHLLEYLIKCHCSEGLRTKMRDYIVNIKTFQSKTTITDFIRHGQKVHLIDIPGDPDTGPGLNISECFQKVVTIHRINPDTCTLSKLEDFRNRLCNLKLNLSDCALRVYHLRPGSIIIEWLATEEFIEEIMTFLSDGGGFDFMWRYNVESITIDGRTFHTVRMLIQIGVGILNYESAFHNS